MENNKRISEMTEAEYMMQVVDRKDQYNVEAAEEMLQRLERAVIEARRELNREDRSVAKRISCVENALNNAVDNMTSSMGTIHSSMADQDEIMRKIISGQYKTEME